MIDRNALGDETSPYLLQHKDNPVHWQAWNGASLAEAQRQDKPILLSVGYAACHWCHVMAHESFENPHIAALMNQHFVNIKVDREERPDIDAIYQQALALLGEQGGWPLTMFLTPQGEPYWGGTYFPPEPRWGRPGFNQVLLALANAYRNERDAVSKNVTAITSALRGLSAPAQGKEIPLELTDRVLDRLAEAIDPINGGIGGAPKFPQTPLLNLLWHGFARRRDPALRNAVTLTLDHLCQGGIYDHLGGGFARYSVDERWLVPHFEKMLYDNAQLIELLTHAWQETKSPLYAQRVRETIDWLDREMRQAEGGFASSLDADSEHEEGKFYVWGTAEIDTLLGDRAGLFKTFYDVTENGNWEGHNILNRLAHIELAEAEIERELAEDRAVLFAAKNHRIRPGLDDKVLADWNGLLIAALAYAGFVFGQPHWLALSETAFAFVERKMTRPDGRLWHSYRADSARHPATLDDYANLSRAALMLNEATGHSAYLQRARDWVELAERYYADASFSGYFLSAADTQGLITRPKTAHDAATPSGNGIMVEVLARLYYITGEETYRESAERAIAAFAGDVPQSPAAFGALLTSNEILRNAIQLVIRGRRGEPDTEALLRAINRFSLPARILLVADPDEPLTANHAASGKTQIGGKATLYICRGQTCSQPITEEHGLTAEFARLVGALPS